MAFELKLEWLEGMSEKSDFLTLPQATSNNSKLDKWNVGKWSQLDLRKTNLLFVSPPYTTLANGASFGFVDLSPSVLGGTRVTSFSGDVPDYFYRSELHPELSDNCTPVRPPSVHHPFCLIKWGGGAFVLMTIEVHIVARFCTNHTPLPNFDYPQVQAQFLLAGSILYRRCLMKWLSFCIQLFLASKPLPEQASNRIPWLPQSQWRRGSGVKRIT